MADRPLLMSAPMVRATLAGIKSQTRRILNPAPRLDHFASEQLEDFELRGFEAVEQPDGRHLVYRPRWRAGDRAWIRETWAVGNIYDGVPPSRINPTGEPNWCGIRYAATDERLGIHDRPSIHIPRWASRLTLTVGQVAVERLQDITEEAAQAEGVCHFVEQHERSGSWAGLSSADRALLIGQIYGSSRKAFQHLWETLHGTEAWEANPWVAAISFEATPANIDNLPEQP